MQTRTNKMGGEQKKDKGGGKSEQRAKTRGLGTTEKHRLGGRKAAIKKMGGENSEKARYAKTAKFAIQ